MNKTMSPKTAKKIQLQIQEEYRPRNQLWFNPPSMTVQNMQKLTNLKAHRVHSLRARFSEPETPATQFFNTTGFQSRNSGNISQLVNSPGHYRHKTQELNLKSILNNMREARIQKLKREIALQNEKEDQNVINAFAISPNHNMKIWMPFHVKYIDREQNRHEKVKPGTKLETNPSFRDQRPNMLEFTLEHYIKKLYSPKELIDDPIPFQSQQSKKMINSMQKEALDFEGAVENCKTPTSPSRYMLVSSEDKLNDEARKRVMRELKKKYVKRISKRSINDFNHQRLQSDSTLRHTTTNLFEEGRKKLEEIGKEHQVRRKQTKRRLNEEWTTYKKNHHIQIPTQFSQQMQQKQMKQKRGEMRTRAKGIMNEIIKAKKQADNESGPNSSLIRTPGVSTRKIDRDSLHYRVSRTYGEKLLRLNLASPPNFHEKLNTSLVVGKNA